MDPTPGGTVTLLFTDLVSSTELAQRSGDDAAQALRRAHDRILRETFRRFAGDVVKNTGDGFFVAFGSARQAVECAAAVQREIAEQHAQGRYPDLSVRIGVHTGEPVREDGDLFGIDVVLASRIMDQAVGGQILTSDITHQLARAHTALRFTEDGERRLKGISDPVRVFSIDWRGLEHHAPRRSRFVGREQEHARLRARFDAALGGRGSVVLIAGEPGVGKTRLATEAAVDARDRGMRVLTGHAFETEGLPPYHAFIDALTPYLSELPSDEAQRLLADDAPYVAMLMPDLARKWGAHIDAPPASDVERFTLFDALTSFLRRAAAETPLVLLLDDLHWSDRATVLLVQHLMRHAIADPLVIVGTYRDVEVPADHPLVALVDELARSGTGERISLRPLSRDDAAHLIEDVAGEPPPQALSDELYAAAEGNPFYTEELVREIREQSGSLADRSSASLPWHVPESVRHVLLRRLVRLTEPTRRILTGCAILGHDLFVERVAAVTSHSSAAVLDSLEEAMQARVLSEEAGEIAFAHPLIQQVIYGELSTPRRRSLHHQAVDALARLYAGDTTAHVPELAHHALEAAMGGLGVDAAIGYAREAGELALAVFAYDEAAAYYRRAADALEGSGGRDDLRCDLLLLFGGAIARAGDAAAADAAFQAAAACAKELRDGDLLARAALGVGEVRRTGGTVDEPLIKLLQDALGLLPEGDSLLRARALARYAAALYHVEPFERLQQLSREAVAMARRLGDEHILVWVLLTTNSFSTDMHDMEARLAQAVELEQLAERIQDGETALNAVNSQIGILMGIGDIARADACLERYELAAGRLRQPYFLWRAAVYRAMRTLFDGNYANAETLAQQAFALGREAQSEANLAIQFLATQLFAIRWEQGRLSEIAPQIRDFAARYPALRWGVGVAFLHSELGDEAAARAEFESLVSHDLVDIPEDFNQVISLTFLAELCARFEDAKRAPLIYERLLPFEGRNATIGAPAACIGAAARSLGQLASTMGRWDDAERHFRDAISMNDRMGARPFAARTRHDYAVMLLRRACPGDVEAARLLVTEADEEARMLGMQRLRDEIAALGVPELASSDATTR